MFSRSCCCNFGKPCFFESSLTLVIKLEPSNWDNSKWIGFALWASVSSNVLSKYGVIALGDMPQNHWAFEFFTTLIRLENGICLLYFSHDDWFATVGNGKCSQIKVIFESDRSTIYVSNCGVSLLCEQDVDEFNQTNAQCLIKSLRKEVTIYKLTGNDHLNLPSH